MRRLGAIWERLGRILDGVGGVLAAFWEHFGNIFKDFLPYCAKSENCKKHRKNNGFSLIFEVPGGFWGSENPEKSIKMRSERLQDAKTGEK